MFLLYVKKKTGLKTKEVCGTCLFLFEQPQLEDQYIQILRHLLLKNKSFFNKQTCYKFMFIVLSNF